MRSILVGLILLNISSAALAQAKGEVESIGFDNAYRPNCWTPMVVKLVTNEEIRGWIEYYDRDMIKLNRAKPPHLFIRKENIKYIYKDEEAALEPREKP